MFEIKWHEKIYKFDEEVSNSVFKTVKSQELSEVEKLIIVMSVDPKITKENIDDLPKLLLMKIRAKVNEFFNDEDF